jgi:predicted nucleic acid-binding protein
VIYADTSALLKLVVAESESEDLLRYLDSLGAVTLVCSEVGHTELLRSARRFGPQSLRTARALLAGIDTAPLTHDIAALAAELTPDSLRTLDALHVATAMDLKADLVVTYDRRMAEACSANDVATASPGA